MDSYSSWSYDNFWDTFKIVDTYVYYDQPLVFTIVDKWGTGLFLYWANEDDDNEYYICLINYEESLKKLLKKEIDIHEFLTTNLDEDCYRILKMNKFTGEANEYYIPKAMLSEKEYIPQKGVYL